MFKNIRADMKRYKPYGGWWRNLGFWVTLVYRFGTWTKKIKPRVFSLPFRILYGLFAIPIRLFLNTELSSSASIGPGLLLLHPFLVIIDGDSVVGAQCSIYHDVTFGRGNNDGKPVVSDCVVIFPGARILGGITIGENAHIGANTVVNRNVAPWSMIVPPTTRPLPMQMSQELITAKSKKQDCSEKEGSTEE